MRGAAPSWGTAGWPWPRPRPAHAEVTPWARGKGRAAADCFRDNEKTQRRLQARPPAALRDTDPASPRARVLRARLGGRGGRGHGGHLLVPAPPPRAAGCGWGRRPSVPSCAAAASVGTRTRGRERSRTAALPPCPVSAGSGRETRTLDGGPASASGAGSLPVPESPEWGGRRGSARLSGDPPPLAPCPAWAAGQRPGATGGGVSAAWLSRGRVTLPRAHCPRQRVTEPG